MFKAFRFAFGLVLGGMFGVVAFWLALLYLAWVGLGAHNHAALGHQMTHREVLR